MSFQEYMRRPVYVAQVKTAQKATQLGIFGYRFRVLPAFRDATILHQRKQIADAMRAERHGSV